MKMLFNKANAAFLAILAGELFWMPVAEKPSPYLGCFILAMHIVFLIRFRLAGGRVKKLATDDVFFIFYLIVFVWNVCTAKLALMDSFLYPSPGLVVKLMLSEIPVLMSAFVSSIALLAVGFSLALTLGVSLALIIGWSGRLYHMARPLTKILGPIPPIVYVPYSIAILPTFRASSIFIVFIGAFWPIFINTLNGVFSIEKGILDSARAIHVGNRNMVLHVILPGCVPAIISGATIGLSFSFILLTSAEMIGSTNGLGWYVKYFSEFANYPKVLVGIIFIGIVVSIIMWFAGKLERHLLRWRKN